MPRIGGALDIVQVSDPATPVAGRQYLYFKSDGHLYTKKPDGLIVQVDGGSAPSNMMTTDTTQSVVAKKTFTVAPQIGDPVSSATHAVFGAEGSLLSIATASYVADNLTFDGTNWRYIVTGPGSMVALTGGTLVFYNAASGSAGAIATVATLYSVSAAALTKSAAFWPTGLTGAIQVVRLVGGTTTGPPLSGTFAVGDLVIARDGHLWICTGAGTPGTWADVGGRTVVSKVAAYTAVSGDIVLANGTFIVTIPVALNTVVTVKNTGVGTITLAPASGTLDGAANFILNLQYASVDVASDGTNVWIV